MITLKKSFEVQNYLKGLISSGISILTCRDNITTVTQKHLRKKACPDADNEEITKPKNADYDFSIDELIDFICYVQEVSEKLTKEINRAKNAHGEDFDGSIAINNRKREIMNCFLQMQNLKSTEKTTQGRAAKFNVAGDQTYYTYDINEVTTIDFDRNKVKGIVKKLRGELDETSASIDLMQLNLEVDFNTIFDIGETIEDAIDKWKTLK